MILTMKEISAFEGIMNELSSLRLPAKTAYKISRIAKKVETELKTFYEMRLKIVQEYGEKDENGELVLAGPDSAKIREESISECNKELEDLLGVQVEFNDNLKISIDSFGDKDIPLIVLHILDPFITE